MASKTILGLLFALAASAPNVVFAAAYHWKGPDVCAPPGPCGGDWNDAENWVPTGTPGEGDTATIDGAPAPDGTGVTGAAGMLDALIVTGNTDLPDCNLTISSSFDWEGGSIEGKVVLSGGTGTFTGPIDLSGGEIDDHGAILWLGGTLTGDSGAILRNFGTLVVSPGTSLSYGAGPDTADIYNTGTFTFTGPGTLSDASGYWGLHNSGTLEITSGAIQMQSAGNTQSSLDPGGVITGNGTLRFTEPNFLFDAASPQSNVMISGITTIAAGATVEISHGGNLLGSGTINGSGTLLWSGGYVSGGTDQAPVVWGADLQVHMTGTEVKDMSGGVIDNKGTVTWDAGDFGGSAGTHFINEGTFSAAADLNINYSPSGGPDIATFTNRSMFTKTAGTGTLLVDMWGLENYGTTNIASGVLQLGNSQDLFADGSTLLGAIHAVDAPDTGAYAVIQLGGTVTLGAGATLELSQSGIIDGNGTIGGTGTLILNGGEVDANDHQSVALESAVNFANGAVASTLAATATGTLTLGGNTTWTGGSAHVGGTVTQKGSLVFKTAGTFTANSSDSFFSNQGTITSDPGSGTAELFVNVTNAGTIDAKSGTLLFSASYTQTAGTLRLSGGTVAAYSLTGDPTSPHSPLLINIRGGRLEGSGTIDANVGNAAVTAPGGTGAAGSLSILQNFSQTALGSMEIELGGTSPGTFDTLAAAGDMSLNGELTTGLISGFVPDVGNSFSVITGAGANGGRFTNVVQPTGATLAVKYDPQDVVLGVTAVSPVADAGLDGAAAPDAVAADAGAPDAAVPDALAAMPVGDAQTADSSSPSAQSSSDSSTGGGCTIGDGPRYGAGGWALFAMLAFASAIRRRRDRGSLHPAATRIPRAAPPCGG